MRYYLLFNLLLIMGGCFLPWLHSALFVVRLRGIDMVDGKVVLAIAAFAFLGALYQLIRKKGEKGWLFYGIAGLAVVATTGLDLFIFYKNRYPIGPGIYLSFLGGMQLVGCFLKNLLSAGQPSRFDS